MNRLISALFLLPSITFGAPFDLQVNQRNIADTATILRTMPLPALNVSNIFATDEFTNLPRFYQFGASMAIISGKLECGPDWMAVVNKPTFAAVATTGAYSDLTGAPTMPSAQVNSDWAASSGVEQILNKPNLFSGDYSALTSIPASFTPSAHNQAFSTITATPTTLAGYGIADGATLTQLAMKMTIPAGTSAQYVRGDGVLATLPVGKRIETFTGNTDVNGLITVTYSPAYPSVPSVQPGPPPSSDMSWVLVSSTTTGFSIRLVQRSVLTVLSLQVLAGTVTNVASSPTQVLVVGQ